MHLFTSGLWCVNTGLIRMANWYNLRIRARCKNHWGRLTCLSSLWLDWATNRRAWCVWKAIWTDCTIVASAKASTYRLTFALIRQCKVQWNLLYSSKIATLFRLLHTIQNQRYMRSRWSLSFSRLISAPAVHWKGAKGQHFILLPLWRRAWITIAHRSDLKVA